MARIGFGGQWVAICKVGKVADSSGTERNLSTDFFQKVIANYNPNENEAPIVVGHPDDNSPAFGWTSELRLNDGVLEAKFIDVPDEFEVAVAGGLYRKRSASFYLDKPNLRHVGFLGAQPPAVKGLKNIQFNEGQAFTVETINFQEKNMQEKDFDNLPDSAWEKIKQKLGFGEKTVELEAAKETTVVGFSEDSARQMIDAAVAKVTADFKEQLVAKDEKITALETKMNASSASGRRAEIASFVESLSAEQGKHYLKRAGVVDFLESLAVADANDKEKAINFSEGDGDKKVDYSFSRYEWAKEMFRNLPANISFGESFGGVTIELQEQSDKNPKRVSSMKKKLGVGGEK